MYSSQLKVSLLSLSVLLAISTNDVMAAKLTIEQRLELLESELSANKKELQKTQSQLSTYKGKVAELQKALRRMKNVSSLRVIQRQRHRWRKILPTRIMN